MGFPNYAKNWADWGNLGIIFSMLHNKFGHIKERIPEKCLPKMLEFVFGSLGILYIAQ
jgi:hypothetical protein